MQTLVAQGDGREWCPMPDERLYPFIFSRYMEWPPTKHTWIPTHGHNGTRCSDKKGRRRPTCADHASTHWDIRRLSSITAACGSLRLEILSYSLRPPRTIHACQRHEGFLPSTLPRV